MPLFLGEGVLLVFFSFKSKATYRSSNPDNQKTVKLIDKYYRTNAR